MADTIGLVVVTDLVVRSAPGVGESSEILEIGLTDGDLVYVIDGPVAADGYEWLLVSDLAPAFASAASGWVAQASREGEEWVRSVPPECPTEVSMAALAPVPPPLLMKCFGGQELTLDGAIGFCAHGDPIIAEPEWLTNYFCAFELPGKPDEVKDWSAWPSLVVHLPDGLDVPGSGEELQAVRITGRFDSPAAQTCQFTDEAEVTFPDLRELDEYFLRFNCRVGFVVDSASLIDPDAKNARPR